MMHFLAILLISGAATGILLFLAERLAPSDFLPAGMRGEDESRPRVRQLGGLAIAPVLIVMIPLGNYVADANIQIAGLGFSILLLWLTGLADDRRELGVGIRLAAQALAAATAALSIGPDLNLLPYFDSLLLDRLVAAAFLIWMVNITNFMDGMDLMTASGVGVPAFLVGIVLAAFQPWTGTLTTAAILSGCLLGFAPFNRPPARLFLGDNGALPVGLIAGILSLLLASQYGLPAALLPFAYYHFDAGLTLAKRLARGENILRAHTGHFYQHALRSGHSPLRISAVVAAISACLVALFAVVVSV